MPLAGQPLILITVITDPEMVWQDPGDTPDFNLPGLVRSVG